MAEKYAFNGTFVFLYVIAYDPLVFCSPIRCDGEIQFEKHW